jgi:hypothetical protein
LVEISDDSPNQHQLKPHQFLVTYRYGSFESGAPVECEPTLSAAVEDLIATCRITDQPLAFDAAGVVASASAPASAREHREAGVPRRGCPFRARI